MSGKRPRRPDGVAVVGMACRFPGATNPDGFWQNLVEGVESITFFSDDELALAGVDTDTLRHPHYVKAAPVLDDSDAFDAAFFGYAPREARLIDPQHRVFLEVAWEAFEAAGYDPVGDKGVVGVYAGAGGLVSSQIVAHDHPELRGQTGDLGHIGNDRDFLCPRVSFKLNLTGPSVNVQTACSTSLVAVHMACQSLMDGEVDMALAGASVIRTPHVRGYFAEPGGIYSPDGHCRAFDAQGAGTLFGSGVAAVVLKPLDAALDDGDHIHAVIKGSAVTNDGAMKVNFTASAAESQARAVVEALELAGVDPDSIGYLECHGTGTAVGDPIEIQALTRAFRLRTERSGFCPVGSVKTNFGHLEQCAGIAGLIKAILAVEYGRIPPSLHFETPNPRIPFERSPFFVNTELRAFPNGKTPRRAGVNSIGMGGTNAFVVVEQAPRRRAPAANGNGRDVYLLNLSAKSEAALDASVRNLRASLARDNGPDLTDICFTANRGRHHFPLRFSVVGSDRTDLLNQLDRYLDDDRRVVGPGPAPGGQQLVFLFSGQGAQYAGMGEGLYRSEPRFRDALDRCLAQFEAHGIAVADVLFGTDDARLGQTLYTQPALFSLQTALCGLWEAWGVQPDAVVGHSIGEFAAAVAAGALTVEDAAQLVAARARLMHGLRRAGAMVAVAADPDTVRAAWSNGGEEIAIAAENAPDSTVVSGSRKAIRQLARRLERQGVPNTEINVSQAFHSPLMDPILAPFAEAARAVEARSPRLVWISTLTGAEVTAAPDADYWTRQIREPVRFGAAVRAAAGSARACVEIGPGATLIALGQRSVNGAADAGPGPSWVASLPRHDGGLADTAEALRQIYLAGHDIRWERFEGDGGRRVRLPTYPFERRHWRLEAQGAERSDADGARPALAFAGSGHPVLGDRVGLDDLRFEALLAPDRPRFLIDHQVFRHVILPTTAALDAVTAAALRFQAMGRPVIEDFLYQRALALAHEHPAWLQITLEPAGDRTAFRVESAGLDAEDGWVLHASGTVRDNADGPAPAPRAPSPGQSRWREVPVDRFYRFLDARGLSYGPAFRGIVQLWRDGDEALARVELPDAAGAADDFVLHPAFLDACLHIYPAVVRKYGRFDGRRKAQPLVYVPIGVESYQSYRAGVTRAWVHATARARDGEDEARVTLDIDVYAEDGRPVARFGGLTIQEASEQLLVPDERVRPDPFLYQLRWQDVAAAEATAELPDHWYVFADDGGVGDRLAARLAAEGRSCVLVRPAASARATEPGCVALDPTEPAGFAELLGDAPEGSLGLVYLWPLDAGTAPDPASEPLVCGGALHLVQAVDRMREHRPTPCRLWLVTRDAQGDAAANVAQAPVWGLGRTVAIEYPDIWGGLVDLPAGADEDPEPMLWREIRASDTEDQIAWRDGRRLAARLSRLPAREIDAEPAALSADATYWIVGGLGDVGLETAAALVRAGARHLLLTGRSADAESETAIADLRRRAEVTVLAADACSESDVTAALQHVDRHMPPLKGVVHAAAVFEDAVLANTTWAQFDRVLAPKVAGAWQLHRCTGDLDLDFFVLFSSVLSLWGAAGQAAYTAANSGLDALARFRRLAGLPATVVNWGPWATPRSAERWGDTGRMLWDRRGTGPLPADAYLDAMLRAIAGGPAQVAVCATDWDTYLRQFATVPALLSELGSIRPARARLDHLWDEPAQLIEAVRRIVADVLGLAELPEVNQPLNELGLDSLLAVNLVNRLRADLNATVPTALLLKGVSVATLVAAVGAEHPDAEPGAPAAGNGTARVSGNGWLIFHRPNPDARLRLLCFPFAGGGAATFRDWTDHLDPEVELVAIEPPGRQTRLDEPPIRDTGAFVAGLVPELLPFLDRPYAVYGHCLGALTLFETVRALLRDHGLSPMHVFVSGARPPDELQRQQDFETGMLERLLPMRDYSVFEPIYRQPDDVFAAAIRLFNIPATDHLLDDPELRRLILPVIRAEFEMSSRYRYVPEPPWDVPITCLTGSDDVYATKENARSWSRFTRQRFQMFELESEHFIVVDEDRFVIDVLNRELRDAP